MRYSNSLKLFLGVLILLSFGPILNAQKSINFKSSDGLTVFAKLYETADKNSKIMLLCHQARSGKTEYKETAAVFNKLGYTCLAIDQRSGDTTGFNETVIEARKTGMPTSYLDAEADILAAIQFLYSTYKKKITIVGSSYSASLIIKIASDNSEKIEKLVAFSPGEYFEDKNFLKNALVNLKIPVFITGGEGEEKELIQILSAIENKNIIFLKPLKGGKHGAKTLLPENKTSSLYWAELTKFLK
jgi:predicted alpha/beta superfamily hydrolase